MPCILINFDNIPTLYRMQTYTTIRFVGGDENPVNWRVSISHGSRTSISMLSIFSPFDLFKRALQSKKYYTNECVRR